jgi:ferredoxin
MKVQISDLCTGHGRCYVLYGDLFESDDLGYAKHRGGEFEVPEGMEELARKGASVCPERAITIVED